jgi:signal transduction histidine kinase/CheY-like chemotaxis protein/HPt (histidine-containing phosphotransfer) domain-containing protein
MVAVAAPLKRPVRLIVATGALAALGGSVLVLLGVAGPWAMLAIAGSTIALIGALWPDADADGRNGRAGLSGEGYQQLLAELEKHKQLERDLIAAKQAAEAATMSKGEFLATMSHEIRTPLNGIIPLLDILLSGPTSPDQRDYLQTAYGSARQLLRIVDDILDYSKLEANKLELENVGLNLKELLESVLRLMDKSAETKGLRLILNIDPAVRLALRGDPVRLRQILTNLISNAVKFTERGNVTVNVIRRGETRTQHELRFEIRDTGVGIAPDQAAKLFRPFSQADASTTRTYGGTGLGLVICKRIVDLMGGQIGVESAPGRGSLFWFQIPLLKAHGDIGSRRRELNGARILLVTANPAQQRRFAIALPSWGAMFVHASNTQEAISKLRAAAGRSSSWAFDLMLVDAGSIPTTVLALHRSVMRETALEDLHILYLGSDDDLPGEIAENERVRILSRGSTDIEVRTHITRGFEGEGRPAVLAVPAPAPAPDVSSTTPARGPTLPPDAPIRGHVLLVEDNPVNRQVAQRLLTLTGLTIDCAENGREALDRIDSGAYDAVLMDCQMPIMDGYSATRQRRQQETEGKLIRLPIIAMTANAMVGDREKCLAAGMDDYLSKPLNRALLEETLRRWLPLVPVAQPASASSPPAAATGTGANAAVTRRAPPVAAAPAPMPPARSTPMPAARAVPLPTAPSRPAPAPATLASAAELRPNVRDLGRSTPFPGHAAPAAPVTARTVPSATVLDREIVDDLREIMGGEFLSLVQVFLEDAPNALRKLEAAAAHRDLDGLVGPAHSLKSTSANLGALALSDIARTIEQGARLRNLGDPLEHVAALGREFHRVEAALRAFMG